MEGLVKAVRILVTGATGFLGSHIVRALVAERHGVVATARVQSNRWRLEDQADRICWVSIDLSNPKTIADALELNRPEIVLHCAAYGMDYTEQSLEEAVSSNILGTQRLLEEASRVGVRRFIHVGSCFEYGDKSGPVSESDVLEPVSMYGATKAAATLLTIQQSKVLGVPTVVVRPFGLYGPYDREDKFVPQVIRACLAGSQLDVTGGEQVRDYTYSDDAVRMFVQLVETQDFPAGEILNLASGRPVRLREIGDLVANLMNAGQLLRWGARHHRPDELKALMANIDKARRLIGWEPRTSLEKGLADTILWYKTQSSACAQSVFKATS